MIQSEVRPALLIVCVVALAALPSPASALTPSQIKCLSAVGKAGLTFVRAKLKVEHQCRNVQLAGGSCTAPDQAILDKIRFTLHAKLEKACTLASEGLAGVGFPGPCADANVADGFTPSDLADCIESSHDDIVGQMLVLQYDPALTAPLAKERLACQKEVAKQSAGLVACTLKAIQKCRAGVMKGKVPVPAHLCATHDDKTASTIAKCRSKLEAGIRNKCGDEDVASLAVCAPNTTTVDDAVPCLVNEHTVLMDGPAIDVPPDLIDYEYAVRGGLCGDGVVNSLGEECDGPDDAACPGACGGSEPDGYFACLCTTKPRLRIVEHADADTDNGWTGKSADAGVAEGGGYVADLYDCDGFGNCNVGPSCSLPPHSPCNVLLSAPPGTTGDQICGFYGQGVCRKERTATGPHCFQNIQKKCDPNQPNDPVCDDLGDSCVVTLEAPPNPAFSGGVTVCNTTVFTEDVVGTVNLATGHSWVRAPQRARTYSRQVGAANKPCPICGGFCGVSRERCTVNEECVAGQGPCITAPVCSDGANAGKPCRTAPPFGNATTLFGTTSVDCPPHPDNEITTLGGVDLYVTERSTGTVTMSPTVPCSAAGFTGNACLGGTSGGRPCTSASECPGGDCSPQCFCAGQARPNGCESACVGGSNEAGDCMVDSECPGGFCHAADCRVDPSDPGSVQEGICTTGPNDSWCSITTYQPCTSDAGCSQASCSYCEPNETCVPRKRACFVNSGIMRQGTPHTPEGVSVGIYCIQGDNEAVNIVAGFPGPAAFTQPELQLVVP